MRNWTLSTNEILQILSTTTTQSVELLRHMSSSQVGKQRIRFSTTSCLTVDGLK
ncbi:unnamed protein product [Lactuca saligna]|uniref:Uncharacterized protein n=1 Tax=Lactuca saligna TaxID=75948 RepID=A0AA36ER99_LACSI|nr:unnamed protein product [Lactuca saligna]